jgi:uncharacterized Zn-binding protein involved in type VI secretion
MGKKVARLGDLNSAGGPIITNVSQNVFINNKPAAMIGSLVAPHSPYKGPHRPPTEITSGAPTVFVNNRRLAHIGSSTTCGHPIATGSPDVEVG